MWMLISFTVKVNKNLILKLMTIKNIERIHLQKAIQSLRSKKTVSLLYWFDSTFNLILLLLVLPTLIKSLFHTFIAHKREIDEVKSFWVISQHRCDSGVIAFAIEKRKSILGRVERKKYWLWEDCPLCSPLFIKWINWLMSMYATINGIPIRRGHLKWVRFSIKKIIVFFHYFCYALITQIKITMVTRVLEADI